MYLARLQFTKRDSADRLAKPKLDVREFVVGGGKARVAVVDAIFKAKRLVFYQAIGTCRQTTESRIRRWRPSQR